MNAASWVFLAAAIVGWALLVCALIGTSDIVDRLRDRNDALNSRVAYLNTLLAERDVTVAEVRPISAAPSFGRIADLLAANEAQRALDNDARIHGWLGGGDVS